MAKRKTRGLYHGYLVIDKPAGWTSHDVVGKVRRIVGERRVGHAGTLDPAAVGVLPIAVGVATRTVEYLSDASKSYVADVTFGVTTDSADIDGVVTSTKDASDVTRRRVIDALAHFEGGQLQVPPMHSAIRVDGVRLYEHARRGESVEVAPRAITIHEIRLEEWDAEAVTARIFVHCSKGTYVRSLARDLGERVGTGAFLSNLVRVSTGPFGLADAVRLDELEDLMQSVPWELIAYHPDTVMPDWPAVVLDTGGAIAWKQGRPINVDQAGDLVRVYDSGGTWLGVGLGDPAQELVRPVKVVTEE